MALTKATLIDLNSNELILDLDADTSITADTDDTIHFKIAGADELVMTGTALTPAVADGSALGSTALEWSDIFLADGAVINFGADQDINITHVADTGLTTNADFTVGDDLFVSGGLIDLKNTGTVSTIKFYCESSNAHAQSVVSAPHSEAASNTLTLPGTGGNARLVSTSSTATLTNKTLTTPVIAEIDSGSTITLDATTDIVLDADGGDIFFKDGGTTFGSATNTSGNLIIKSGTTTAATFSGANVTLAGTVGSGAITSSGLITSGAGLVIADAGNIGSASDTDAIAIGSDGDVTLTQDLELQHDGAILSFGANDEVSLTHVHDTGILLNSTNVIQFNDASQNIGAPSATVLDINATDEIELNATLVDINANVEISGTAVTTGVHTFTAVPVFPNNTVETADIQADAITGAKIADDAINSEHYTDGSIDTAHIADNQVTLAKMAGGTDGNLITYDASGDPAYVATGSDGQVLTSAGAGAAPTFEALPSSGKVLQVKQVVKLDTATTTSAHGTYADISGMSLAITPSASNSKILVLVNGATSPANNNYSIAVNLVRGSTSIFLANSRSSATRASDWGLCQANQATSVNIAYLDSPATTSAVTYKLQFSVESGSTALFGGSHSSGGSSNGSVPGSLVLMEIGA